MRMTTRCLLLFIPVLLASYGVAMLVAPWVPFSFLRIFNRCLLGFAFPTAFFFQKKIRKKPFSEIGLEGKGTAIRDISKGLVLSLIFFTAVTWVSLFFGFSLVAYHPPPHMRKIFNYVLASILTAFFEEFFFRGLLFKVLSDDCSVPVSLGISSGIYSLAHFIRPFFTKSADLSLFYTESIGLFLFGILLAYAFYRTGSLYFSMGLHGGFVLLLKLDGIFINRLMREPVWLFGEERLVGGIVTWPMFLAVFLCIRWLTRRRNC